MDNLESGIGVEKQVPRSESEHLAIPMEYVLGEQQLLMRLMVPVAIKPYVTESDGKKVGIEDGLFMRWHEKYSKLFREYCDNLDANGEEERKRIERIVSGRLTSDDYAEIRQYLADPARENKKEGTGGPFFTDEEDEREFLKLYVQ